MFRLLHLSIYLLIGTSIAIGQTKEPKKVKNTNGAFSNFIGGFSLHASTGFGVNFYSHEIKGPGLFQQKDGNVYLFDNFYVVGDSLDVGYAGWVNNAQPLSEIPIGDEDFLLGTDTIPIKYKGTGGSIPFTVAISYTYDRWKSVV